MLSLTLTEEAGAAAAARRGLLEGNGLLPPAIRDDVLLLVSELVTNAVRHAGAGPERPVQVQLLHGPRGVVGAVVDDGPGFTRRPNPSTGNESGGWGLFLVDQIADRWGVDCTTCGSRVWFEIEYEGMTGDLPAPPQQPPSRSAAST
jgi:anti-sigma regulatory factor (Ser/Thr protein kinase)